MKFNVSHVFAGLAAALMLDSSAYASPARHPVPAALPASSAVVAASSESHKKGNGPIKYAIPLVCLALFMEISRRSNNRDTYKHMSDTKHNRMPMLRLDD